MVINSTKAVETKIQEVSPVSSFGAGAAGVSATGASAVVAVA